MANKNFTDYKLIVAANLRKLKVDKTYKMRQKEMKKLFVSVPMKGRTEEEIKASIQKMKKIAEIYEGEELELIDSYIKDNPPKDRKEAVWYLGESLKKLAQADVFIGIFESWIWASCMAEEKEAYERGIKIYNVSGVGVIENYEAIVESLHVYEREILPK